MVRVTTLTSLLVLSMAVGCDSGDSGASGTGNPTPTTAGGTTDPGATSGGDSKTSGSMVTTGADDTTGGDESPGETGSFVMPNDAGMVTTCDVWAQDCDDGEKCVHFSQGAADGNGNKCVPIAANAGQTGDPCDGTQIAAGIDDCDFGHYCSFLDDDGQGICIPMCGGSANAPECPSGMTCAIDNDGTLISCTEDCDPVLQDCAAEIAICMPATGTDKFNCATGWSTDAIQEGEPCYYSNSCAEGLYCNYDPASVPNCEGDTGCCAPYCDLTANNPDDNTNPTCDSLGAGVQCVPWNPDTPPPGLEHVGICLIPE